MWFIPQTILKAKSLQYTEGKILTVDPNTGLVTLTGGYGQASVTATSYGGKEVVKDTITLDVYVATVESAIQIVNAINTEWAKHFSSADSKFDYDWARSGAIGDLEYSSNGFSFTRPYLSMDGASTSVNNATVSLSELIGDNVTINSNTETTFNISLYDESGLETIGTERVKIISTNNASLNVVLPFNQGTATITYESIRVKDDRGNNTRGGYYSVDFSSEILGVNGENFDRTGNNKINDATEAGNITKLIYG